LEQAYLYGVDLKEVNLGYADLEGANLGYAHLEGAYLDGAQLEKADLTGAHLEGARADRTTVWPDSLDWQAAGVVMHGKRR